MVSAEDWMVVRHSSTVADLASLRALLEAAALALALVQPALLAMPQAAPSLGTEALESSSKAVGQLGLPARGLLP
jgi:hypothetical protein